MYNNTSDIFFNDLKNKALTKCHSERSRTIGTIGLAQDKLSEESITLYILSVYRFFPTLRRKWLGSIKNDKMSEVLI